MEQGNAAAWTARRGGHGSYLQWVVSRALPGQRRCGRSEALGSYMQCGGKERARGKRPGKRDERERGGGGGGEEREKKARLFVFGRERSREILLVGCIEVKSHPKKCISRH